MEKTKQDDILNAATLVFAKKGVNDAKLYQIAEEANVAVGLIYSYFEKPVKLDILLSIFIDFWKNFNALVEEKISMLEDPKSKLIAILDILSDLLIKDELAIYRAKVIGESIPYVIIKKSEKMKEKRNIITSENRRLLAIIDEIIKTGQEKGLFYDDLKPSIIRQFLYGAVELSIYGLFLKVSRDEPIGYEEADIKEGTHKLFERFLCKA